jgi:polyhydroxybutyrate depolymerase
MKYGSFDGVRATVMLAVFTACSCSSDTEGAVVPTSSGAGGSTFGIAGSDGQAPFSSGGGSASGGSSTGGFNPSGGTSVASGTGGDTPQPASGGQSPGGTTAGGGASGVSGDSGVDGARVDAGDSGVAVSPVGDWGPGDYPPDITAQTYLEISGVPGQGSYTRQYKVHVPPSYDPKVPTPVVFCIHGLAQNAVMFCVTGAAMDKKSDAAGFILVMPNGYQSSWNAGTCCGGASNEQLDDVALFRAIFDEVNKHLNIDHRRVFATGLSNGAYMSYRLACEASDLFAAVAPGAGAIGINSIGGGTNPTSNFTTCNPSAHVSVLDIHGTADPLIPYSLQAPSLSLISGKNGCGTSTVPATSPKSAGDTTCVSYSGCPNGIEVIGCSIANGGHCWFGSPDCGTGGGAIGAVIVGANSNTMINTDAVWDFFSRMKK